MKKLLFILLLMSSPLLADSVTLQCQIDDKDWQLIIHLDRQTIGFGGKDTGFYTKEFHYLEDARFITFNTQTEFNRAYEWHSLMVLDKENLTIRHYQYKDIYEHNSDNGPFFYYDHFLKSHEEDWNPEYRLSECKKIKTIYLL
jgi:hypothetical protein